MHLNRVGPGRVELTARALEDAHIAVYSDPMFSDLVQEADQFAIFAFEFSEISVVGGNFGGCVPGKEFLALNPF